MEKEEATLSEKLGRLLDALIEVCEAYTQEKRKKDVAQPLEKRGEKEEKASPFDIIPEEQVPPMKRGRKPKEAVSIPAANGEAVRARFLEVSGGFIKRHLRNTPTGLERAKAIMAEVCGRPINRLDELTQRDHEALIPRFERELETTR